MNERKTELDVIRIISCFFVVVVHVAGYGMEIMEPMTVNWLVRNMVVCAVRCAVPVFYMMSGILFMEKELTIKTLYRKYIARIVLAWGVWSAFYAVIDNIAHMKTGEASLQYFLIRFIEGHYHMWFLGPLLIAYIFLPVLQKLTEACSDRDMKYLGLFILAGVIGKETLEPFLKGEIWDAVWSNLEPMGIFVGVIYFVLGYYLYKKGSFLSTKLCMLLYLLAVVVMAGINMFCAYISGMHAAVANGYLSAGVLVSSSAFFLLLLQKISVWKLNEKQWKWIRKISESTFGIYLLHTFFIEQVYRRMGLTQDRFPAGVAILLFSGVTFIISFLTVRCIRRVPVFGRWIV